MEMKDGESRRNGLAGLSLSAILGEGEKPMSPANRTLMDIISEDPNSGFKKNKKNWTAFKDMIRLHRAGVAWTSIVTIPVSDVNVPNLIRSVSSGAQSFRRPSTLVISDPIHEPSQSDRITGSDENHSEPNSAPIPINRAQMVRRDSSRVPAPASKRYSSLNMNIAGDESPEAASSEGSEGEEEEEEKGIEESTSLMALMDFNEEDEDEDEDSDESVDYSTCSVCMVSHKGGAFVCGHAFCRLCSRELWVQRGTTCPLCNGFVVEILHIF